MRIVSLLIAFMLVGDAVSADDCNPPPLSRQAYRIVRPFMELRSKQVREQYTEDGLWRGESRYTPEVDKMFQAILRDRSDAGDEAAGYLLNIYMGIDDSERLVCNAVLDCPGPLTLSAQSYPLNAGLARHAHAPS
jgi:hypothetical protein